MDPFCDIKWFAVHTKRFREAVAASSIEVFCLEVFLPMVKVERPAPGAIRLTAKPLFPGYLFARFNAALALNMVERAQGVSYVVKSGGSPIAVEEEIVREIQSRVPEDGLIRLQPRPLQPGDQVCVQDGPFAGMMGLVEAELDDHKRVAILLETLWHARVVMEKHWLETEPV